PGRQDLLHPLLLLDRPARAPRHRRHVHPRLAARANHPQDDHPAPAHRPRARRPLLAPGRRHLDLLVADALPHRLITMATHRIGGKTYVVTFVLLLALTLLSYVLHLLPLGAFGTLAAFVIAAIKVLLVV